MADNFTTPVPDATEFATKDIGGVQFPKNVITDFAGADAMGLVTASPTATTLLGRLKTIADNFAALSTAAKQDEMIAAIEAISPGGGSGGDASAANQTTIIGHVDGIETLLTSIAGYVDGLEALIGTSNTTLATIGGYLDTVETLIAATNTALGTIDGRVDGLETLIGTTNTTLTTIGGYLDTVETLLSGVSAKLPAALGAQTAANSLSVVPASNATFPLAASETVIGATAAPMDLIDVTLTLDTSIYASGDVMAVTQAIANAVRIDGGQGRIDSITVIDEDDQGQAFDLLFLSANNSIGTLNAAVSITDANARDILGLVSVGSSDFIDLGGVRIANLNNIGLVVEAAGGSRSIYVAAISRGTGTYTANGIRLRLGVVWA